ncbi:MAG: type II secretion system F family protein [Lentisphaeria bacterium]|nr:type II secretion system F family protein [Lentisphaeria bacterium]
MDLQTFITYLLIFGAVFCLVICVGNMLPDGKVEKQPDRIPLIFRLFKTGISFFAAEAGGFLEETFPKYSKRIADSLNRADLPLAVKDIYGAQVFFLLLGALMGGVSMVSLSAVPAGQIAAVTVFGAAGALLPLMYIDRMAEEREEEIMHFLPFAIDLISSSMNAGLDFGAAVRYLLATGEENVLHREFALFLQEVELGKNRTEALRDMQKRINVIEFSRFVSALACGMDSGSSVIDIMRIQAEEMRRVKYARAEQQAAKAPTKMIIPMALFVFPSMFIIIFVPIFLRIKDSGILSLIGK